MFQLTLIGFLNGLTAALIVIFATIFSTIILIRSLKNELASLLRYGGFMGLFAGLLWLGPAADFFSILLTGQNMDNSFGLYGILSYMWVGPAVILAILIGSKVTAPTKTKPLVGITTILAVIFEFFLFFFTMDLFEFHNPVNTGEDLIDANFIPLSLGFILIAIFIGLIFIFCGVGSLLMALKSTGAVRKKGLYLATSFFLFCIVAVFDALFAPDILLFIVRFGMVACAFLLYYGVKPIEL